MHHYRTRVQTLGKGRKTLGNFFAECSTRRSAHGLSSTGEADFAECLFSGTRQTFAVCQAALGKKSWNGTDDQANWRTERANGTNGTAERDGVENFAECQTRGTRQRPKLRRVIICFNSTPLNTSFVFTYSFEWNSTFHFKIYISRNNSYFML